MLCKSNNTTPNCCISLSGDRKYSIPVKNSLKSMFFIVRILLLVLPFLLMIKYTIQDIDLAEFKNYLLNEFSLSNQLSRLVKLVL